MSPVYAAVRVERRAGCALGVRGEQLDLAPRERVEGTRVDDLRALYVVGGGRIVRKVRTRDEITVRRPLGSR